MATRIQYATVEDIQNLCLPEAALAGFTREELDTALLSASGEADDYIRASKNPVYPVPLNRWSESFRFHVAAIAAYRVMTKRGYQPQGPDLQLRLLYEDAIKFFTRVSSGGIILDIDPPITTPLYRQARITSLPSRGWVSRRDERDAD